MDLEAKCAKCGLSLRRLMLLAMLVDLGSKVSPSPDECEHEFPAEIAEEVVNARE
jgi:hypothetical protein